jgi:rfaE bifunctional protein nucleotidyltransferase chain/domain
VSLRDKVVSRESLPSLLEEWRRRGLTVVFTNGCFDILHAGHVLLLEKARALGDVLLVGLNSDAGVRSLGKGPGRPVNTEGDRATVLAALASVDAVVLFDEPTPLELIRLVRPGVLVKGADWAGKGVVGQAEVEAAGGRVVLVPLEEGRSTTGLIDRIRNGEKP